jgi:nucleolin
MMSTEFDAPPTEAATKLYIGNLGWDTSTEDLQASFAEFGNMGDCYVVIDRATGESRGFGFVTFSTEEEAQRAVEAMNGREMQGRKIRVDISKPKGSAPARGAQDEGNKIYIGNLGYDTTVEDLRQHFGQHGDLVDITVVTDRDSGNSRGFGFATYSSASEAQAAADSMDGFEMDGRQLRVNISRPRAERNSFNEDGDNFRGGGRGYNNNRGGGGGGAVDASKIFVGNLGWNTSSEDLQEAFSKFGQLTDAKVVTDRDTGNSRGFGFITFESAADAEKAVTNMDGMELDGREIRVNISQPKKPRYTEQYDDAW